MKNDTHPEMVLVTATCTGCGTEFETLSTRGQLTVSICNHCHPFFTGQTKSLDTEGRIDKFNKRQAKREQLQKAK